MAFKPFELFRKRQKLLLAILTILAMVIFIAEPVIGLRTGRRSILGSWVSELFGYAPDRVAVVAGTNLDVQRMHELTQERRSAYSLIKLVQNAGEEACYREAGFSTDEIRARRSQNQAERKKFDDKLADMQKNRPEAYRQLQAELERTRQGADSLAVQAARPFDEFEQKVMFARAGFQVPLSESDFPLSPMNLVEFVLWQKKADALGVIFTAAKTKEDLMRAGGVRADGSFRLTEEDLAAVIRRNGLPKQDQLLTWVANELRAMVARGTIMGPERASDERMALLGGGSAGPLSTQITPLDLWQAYVDVKTQLEVGILPIPVNQKEFMSQVPNPTPEQVKEFYNKYKSQEPNPVSDTPGFRVPRLYKVEFVYGDLSPTADAGRYYQGWAKAIAAMDPVAFLADVIDHYEKNKKTSYRLTEPHLLVVSGSKPEDSGYYRIPYLPAGGPWPTKAQVEQENAAMMALGMAGVAAQTPLAPLGFEMALRPQGQPVPAAAVQRAEVSGLVADAAIAAASGMGVPSLLSYPPRLGVVERYVPLDQIYGALADKLTEDRARKLLETDLAELKKHLADYAKVYNQEYTKWRNRPGARADAKSSFTPPPYTFQQDGVEKKEPLDQFVKSWAEKRGLRYLGMKQPRSRDKLFDPEEGGDTPLGSILKPVFFKARPGFDDKSLNDTVARDLTSAKSVFEAGRVPAEQQIGGLPQNEYVLHWKAQEVDPRLPPLEEIEAKVVEAWKVVEARKLAEEYAAKLAQEVKSQPDGYRLLVDKPDFRPDKILSRFELQPMALGVASYRQATIPVIEYPPADLLDKALEELKVPGDTMTVMNRPKNTIYVLVLRNRKEPLATNATALRQFDLEVITPDQQMQIQVEGRPLSEYVIRKMSQDYRNNWEKWVRQLTKYDEKEADRLKSIGRE